MLLVFTGYCYNNFLPIDGVVGTYDNKNYYPIHSIAEAPNEDDRLTIYKDGNFESGFFGKGTYEISYSLRGGTLINLFYDGGAAGFVTSIKRRNWGKPEIIINEDLDLHYSKSQ